MYYIKICDLLILFFDPANLLLGIFHREIIQICKFAGTQTFTVVLPKKEKLEIKCGTSTEKASQPLEKKMR